MLASQLRALSLGAMMICFSSFISAQAIENLQPFASDGCSAFPDGTIEQQKLWLSCCLAHDYDYWIGGTYSQRLESDKRLKSCVADQGEAAVGVLMLVGVRLGGTPFIPTDFRWGYGWPYPRGYKPLSTSDWQAVKLRTPPHYAFLFQAVLSR